MGLMVIDTLMFLEIDTVEESLHVLEKIDGDSFAADLAPTRRVVGVVAHQRGHVEVDRQSRSGHLGDEHT